MENNIENDDCNFCCISGASLFASLVICGMVWIGVWVWGETLGTDWHCEAHNIWRNCIQFNKG